jgi:hypothetical protein
MSASPHPNEWDVCSGSSRAARTTSAQCPEGRGYQQQKERSEEGERDDPGGLRRGGDDTAESEGGGNHRADEKVQGQSGHARVLWQTTRLLQRAYDHVIARPKMTLGSQ